jgi:hypothetical protein
LVLLAIIIMFVMCAISATLGFLAGVSKAPPIMVQGGASDITMTPHLTIKPSVQVDVPPSTTVVENKVVVPEGPPPSVVVNVPQQAPPIVNVQAPGVSSSGKPNDTRIMYDPALHAKLDDLNSKLKEEGRLLPPPKDVKR